MIEPTTAASATATSPIGAVMLRVHGSSGATVEVGQTDAPDLSEGMAVDGVTLFRVGLATPVLLTHPSS